MWKRKEVQAMLWTVTTRGLSNTRMDPTALRAAAHPTVKHTVEKTRRTPSQEPYGAAPAVFLVRFL